MRTELVGRIPTPPHRHRCSHAAAVVGRLEPAPPGRVDAAGLGGGGDEDVLRGERRGGVAGDVLELGQPIAPEQLQTGANVGMSDENGTTDKITKKGGRSSWQR